MSLHDDVHFPWQLSFSLIHLLATRIANRHVSAKSFNCEAFSYVFYVVEENF